ncbi:MAG: hypothetical protein AAB834_02210 [Patescibacteria group bacterium]
MHPTIEVSLITPDPLEQLNAVERNALQEISSDELAALAEQAALLQLATPEAKSGEATIDSVLNAIPEIAEPKTLLGGKYQWQKDNFFAIRKG